MSIIIQQKNKVRAWEEYRRRPSVEHFLIFKKYYLCGSTVSSLRFFILPIIKRDKIDDMKNRWKKNNPQNAWVFVSLSIPYSPSTAYLNQSLSSETARLVGGRGLKPLYPNHEFGVMDIHVCTLNYFNITTATQVHMEVTHSSQSFVLVIYISEGSDSVWIHSCLHAMMNTTLEPQDTRFWYGSITTSSGPQKWPMSLITPTQQSSRFGSGWAPLNIWMGNRQVQCGIQYVTSSRHS